MGVVRAGGSMSTTTDVIYAHKKFKRAAVESWDGKATSPSSASGRDGIPHESPFLAGVPVTCNKEATSNTPSTASTTKRTCILGNGYCQEKERLLAFRATLCPYCKVEYHSESDYLEHECIVSHVSNSTSSTDGTCNNKEFHEYPARGSNPQENEKIKWNRSLSLPHSDGCKVNNNLHLHEFDSDLHAQNLQKNNQKQLYKPKFRAQYSLQENASDIDIGYGTTILNSLIEQSIRPTSKEIATPINSLQTPYYDSVGASTNSISTGSTSSLQRLNKKSTLIVGTLRNEESSAAKLPHSAIWKGIKSPSPELLGQHITNLIVQNQAIVETQNPLWSMKYKRQNSNNSSHSEAENANKRRYSTLENSRGSRSTLHGAKQHKESIHPEPPSVQSVVPIVPSLPRFSPNSSIPSSPACVPKSHISTSMPHTVSAFILEDLQKDKKTAASCSRSLSCEEKVSDCTQYNRPDLLDVYGGASRRNSLIARSNEGLEAVSLIPLTRNRFKERPVCFTCNMGFSSFEKLEYHLKYSCSSSSKSHNNKDQVYCEQVVALDLQKRSENQIHENKRPVGLIYERNCKINIAQSPHTTHRSSARDSGYVITGGEDVHYPGEVSASPSSHLSHILRSQSPPKKKMKITSEVLQPSMFNQIGALTSRPAYSYKMLDELVKPKGNSHHIYGGEVQICDGNAYKTLKIESINNDTPSLDVCIASQQLAAVSEKEVELPTSVVMTIAKCGLNSGGTMVKVENQKLYGNSPMQPSCSHPRSYKSFLSCPEGRSFNQERVIHYPPGGEAPGLTGPNLASFSVQLLPNQISTSLIPNTIKVPCSSANLISLSPSKIALNKLKEEPFPTLLSFGDNKVPYVPGIPGPYSQASIPIRNKSTASTSVQLKPQEPVKNSPSDNSQCVTPADQQRNSSDVVLIEKNSTISSENITKMPLKTCTIKPCELLVAGSKSCSVKPPEIRVQPPAIEVIKLNKPYTNENVDNPSKIETESIDKDFLIPRKRPSTLMIKPQPHSLKSSLSLIGSTLVSPDTPRPKKSCAQLFLNGSAYTYLNLKVSTKTFFCCIYRPQPMYVIQSPESKLSMYSNWQVRKTNDPLKLSPSEAMSLHVSGLYYDRAYTIAKPKHVQLKLTQSSYWTKSKLKSKSHNQECSILDKDSSVSDETSEMVRKSDTNAEDREKEEFDSFGESPQKRIKIFEGGFKTNEDYTYVRGRGRGCYVCETCGIRCKKPSMLKKHIRTHTDLRPFACSHCSFSFKTKGNLTKHLKSKAHFKRCTEMGVIPVPTAVNESHINQEALQMQIKLDLAKGSHDPDGEDDDEDDEEEEEEVDDDYEYEDEDENESIDERLDGMKTGANICPQTAPEMPYNFTPLNVNSLKVSIKESESPKGSNPDHDNVPMDLSIKRLSPVMKEKELPQNEIRPSCLPIATEFIIPNNKYPVSVQSSTTPIKERPSDILSPVTDSSMILKSIYDTTFKVSSTARHEKRILATDPVKDTGSSGFMLQTYLKERAVLDSSRKRQYLASSPHRELSPEQAGTTWESPHLAKALTGKHASSCAKISLEGTSTSYTACSESVMVPVTVVQTSNNSIVLTSSLMGTKTLSANASNALSIVTSSVSESNTDNESSPSQMKSVNNISENPSSSTMIILQPSNGRSSTPCSAITLLTSSTATVISSKASMLGHVGKGHSNLPVTGGSIMPTPPANLTVMNSCKIDSKTAFIAPSGVIPTNHNRPEADDGKCKCSICFKEFAKPAQLSLHMNIHFIERPHRCDSCSTSFRTSGHLQKHKRSVGHLNKVNMNMTFGTPSTENPRPFKCHDCKVAFRIHGHLAKHLRSKLHIMKLECLGKLPFGVYAEIERSGTNLNEIDTSDCENSLESLQVMASKLYEKEPGKLSSWKSQLQQECQPRTVGSRVRTVSNSSNNSDDYPLLDDQDTGSSSGPTTVRSSGEDSDEEEDQDSAADTIYASGDPCPSMEESATDVHEAGSSEGVFGCPKCSQKFMHYKQFEVHYYTQHENESSDGGRSSKEKETPTKL